MTNVLAITALMIVGVGSADLATYESACRFSVSRGLSPAAIIGPHELVSRVRILEQPDSPIAIRRVDVSNLRVAIGGSQHDRDGEFHLEIQNVSDRIVRAAVVLMRFWSGRGGGGSGPGLKRPLAPGEIVTLAAKAGGHSINPGEDMETALELRVVVESVELDGCLYKPAQAHRIRVGGR